MANLNFNGTERRRFVRIPFWFVTKYRLYPHNIETEKEFSQGIGKNISAGGICFETKDKFDEEALLEIEIDMPILEHAVKVIGTIAWVKKQENSDRCIYGLAFKKIKNEDVEAVRKIVESFR